MDRDRPICRDDEAAATTAAAGAGAACAAKRTPTAAAAATRERNQIEGTEELASETRAAGCLLTTLPPAAAKPGATGGHSIDQQAGPVSSSKGPGAPEPSYARGV